MKKKAVAVYALILIGAGVAMLALLPFSGIGVLDEKPEREEIRRLIGEADSWLGERTGRRNPPVLKRIREMVAGLPDAAQRLEAARFFAGQMRTVDIPGDDPTRAFVRVDNFWQTWMEALRCLRENNASEQEQMSFIMDALTKYKEACHSFDGPRGGETNEQKSSREHLAKGLRRHFKDGMSFVQINDLRILSYGLSDACKATLRKWFDEFSAECRAE